MKWFWLKSPQCFHMTTIMVKRGFPSPDDQQRTLHSWTTGMKGKGERERGRWRVKAPVGGSALSFPSSPHCCLLLWQWKHHWMTSSQNTLHIGTVKRTEETIAKWWHHTTAHHIFRPLYSSAMVFTLHVNGASNNMLIPKDFAYRVKKRSLNHYKN